MKVRATSEGNNPKDTQTIRVYISKYAHDNTVVACVFLMQKYTTQNCDISLPVPRIQSLSHSRMVCSFVGGALTPPNDSSKQQQAQSNHFAVAVVVVALGRSLCFLFSLAVS